MNLEQLKSGLSIELESILGYWTSKTPDFKNGGFFGRINNEDIIHKTAERGLVLNARILWTFSAAYQFQPSIEYKEMAFRAYDYLNKHFLDLKNGGAYWLVNYLGIPLQSHKQIYGQGFLLYGFSEFYKAFGREEALQKAKELFFTIEKYAYDEINGGYFEAFSKEWKPIVDKLISSAKAKSMNTHLHIIEPYTNLYNIWKDEKLKSRIVELLEVFFDKIIDKQTATQHLFFDADWKIQSNEISFGHDIEASWLLCEAAEIIEDELWINKTKKLASHIASNTLKYLDTDGGLFYELKNGQVVKEKHWWVQAEALVGFYFAWQASGNGDFLDAVFRLWNFIKHKLKTPTGEWFWGLNSKGEVLQTEDKVGMWKCPYHNSRAFLEILSKNIKN